MSCLQQYYAQIKILQKSLRDHLCDFCDETVICNLFQNNLHSSSAQRNVSQISSKSFESRKLK